MAQAPFRSDLIGWRFAGAIRFGVGKRRLKIARRFNAGENAAGSKVPPGRLNGFHGNRFLSQGISAVPLGLIPFRRQPALKRRAISKGSFGTVFHRGSRREPALTFPPEKNERPAPTRRQPHGKFWPPRDGKVGTDPFMTNNGNYPKMF